MEADALRTEQNHLNGSLPQKKSHFIKCIQRNVSAGPASSSESKQNEDADVKLESLALQQMI